MHRVRIDYVRYSIVRLAATGGWRVLRYLGDFTVVGAGVTYRTIISAPPLYTLLRTATSPPLPPHRLESKVKKPHPLR
jgi:hypothetical protein